MGFIVAGLAILVVFQFVRSAIRFNQLETELDEIETTSIEFLNRELEPLKTAMDTFKIDQEHLEGAVKLIHNQVDGIETDIEKAIKVTVIPQRKKTLSKIAEGLKKYNLKEIISVSNLKVGQTLQPARVPAKRQTRRTK